MPTIVCLSAPKNHCRDPSSRGQHPDEDVDDLSFLRCPEVQGLDGVADGHIAVHTHHGQGEDTSKHVIVVDGDEHFTHYLSKWPGVHQIICALKGHGGGYQGICNSQVEDVDVCGGFHFSVSVGKSIEPESVKINETQPISEINSSMRLLSDCTK